MSTEKTLPSEFGSELLPTRLGSNCPALIRVTLLVIALLPSLVLAHKSQAQVYAGMIALVALVGADCFVCANSTSTSCPLPVGLVTHLTGSELYPRLFYLFTSIFSQVIYFCGC
jgi:hypothetical protein